MSCQEAFSQWEETVSTQMPHLSRPQARVLALWSFGMIFARSCGLSSVAAWLAEVLLMSEGNLRQQLREWCYDAVDKKGAKRQQLEVRTCFAPLLCWILSWWTPCERRLALAMDASMLSDRLTVLCICVVYRGCAIPVAWKLVVANKPGAWQPYWRDLFAQLRDCVESDWTVIVMADRGLYAKWLFELIVEMGWHPFLRINAAGKCRPLQEDGKWVWLSELVPCMGSQWSGPVECFSNRAGRLTCTLLACWEANYAEPWLILTDLPAECANVVWYRMRVWIEGGFKDLKRAGWQWHQTKMRDPARAERLFLAMAVATLWCVSVGGQAEMDGPASSLDALPERHVARRRSTSRSRPRLHRCFGLGLRRITVAFLRSEPLPMGRFLEAPWPQEMPARAKLVPNKKRKPSPAQVSRRKQKRQAKKKAAREAASKSGP